jgi:thiol-disulfide isomerase/thioredoxin
MIDRKSLLSLAAAVLGAVVLGVLVKDALREPQTIRALPKAPAAAAPRPVSLPGGATLDLAAPPERLLIVHFWATWCAPCVEEFPGLLKFWKEFGSRPGLDLLAVSVDGDWKTVEGWIAKVGAGGVPLALDPEKKTASAFGTDKFPETYVLSPSGKVLEKFVGAVDWSSPSVRNRIEQLRQASTTDLSGG